MAMAKLAALVAALLLVSHVATAFRTIITIDEADRRRSEGGGGGSQQCQQEIQQRNLNHCMRYMMEQQRGRRGYNNNNDGVEEEMELNQDHYNQCCNELRMIRDEKCRCEGLQMEMEREMQQGRMRPQDMREMMPTAQKLPSTCGMRPSQCQFDMPSS